MSSETPAPAQKPAKARKPRVQRMLTVVKTHRITPHMVRVILGGEEFDDIEFKTDTDQYIKLLFADAALGLQRPYDLEDLRERLPAEQMPVTRTYTIRHIDREKKQIWVDFVIHGDEGIAGPWAANAQPGDLISFFGPGSGYAPRHEADFHLIAGDEAALPAIAAALESMSQTAKGLALVEVRDAAEEQQFDVPAGIELRWLHRGADFSPATTQLAEELQTVELPEGDVQVFVHGEREQMKAIRRHLVEERGLQRRGMSLSAYWAYGRGEDAFQAEKKLPIGTVD